MTYCTACRRAATRDQLLHTGPTGLHWLLTPSIGREALCTECVLQRLFSGQQLVYESSTDTYALPAAIVAFVVLNWGVLRLAVPDVRWCALISLTIAVGVHVLLARPQHRLWRRPHGNQSAALGIPTLRGQLAFVVSALDTGVPEPAIIGSAELEQVPRAQCEALVWLAKSGAGGWVGPGAEVTSQDGSDLSRQLRTDDDVPDHDR